MSISNRGRSTIWDVKTHKVARTKRRVEPSLTRIINQGYEYFWSRRRVGKFHNGTVSLNDNP